MAALLIGSVLAVAALVFVLWPLLRGAEALRTAAHAPEMAPESSAIEALREIEFDQATGKLSAEDYAALRTSYTPLALAELKAKEAAGVVEAAAITTAGASGSASVGSAGVPPAMQDLSALDPAEQLIARAKSRAKACATCGPRPEADALFCSDCGRVLVEACLRCGARVESDRARFCTECGSALAA